MNFVSQTQLWAYSLQGVHSASALCWGLLEFVIAVVTVLSPAADTELSWQSLSCLHTYLRLPM